MTTPLGKAMLLNAANPPVWRPQDGGTYRFTARHWVVYPEEIMDEETGELRQYAVTVFIDEAGNNVKLSSDFAPRRIHAMMALYSRAEWEAGIEIECFTAESRRKGRRYGSFRIIAPVAPVKENE